MRYVFLFYFFELEARFDVFAVCELYGFLTPKAWVWFIKIYANIYLTFFIVSSWIWSLLIEFETNKKMGENQEVVVGAKQYPKLTLLPYKIYNECNSIFILFIFICFYWLNIKSFINQFWIYVSMKMEIIHIH